MKLTETMAKHNNHLSQKQMKYLVCKMTDNCTYSSTQVEMSLYKIGILENDRITQRGYEILQDENIIDDNHHLTKIGLALEVDKY